MKEKILYALSVAFLATVIMTGIDIVKNKINKEYVVQDEHIAMDSIHNEYDIDITQFDNKGNISIVNYNYKLSLAKYKGLKIYDDGINTFIFHPLKLPYATVDGKRSYRYLSIPEIFYYKDNNKQYVTNYRILKDYIILDGIYDHVEVIFSDPSDKKYNFSFKRILD